jgi:four helix bundle protein
LTLPLTNYICACYNILVNNSLNLLPTCETKTVYSISETNFICRAITRINIMSTNNLTIRLFEFSVNIFNLIKNSPYNVATKPIISQLIRSATSVGANYEEAQASVSKADFISKIHISLKEIREACYWLKFSKATFLSNNQEIDNLINESEELKKILGSIAWKSRQNLNNLKK